MSSTLRFHKDNLRHLSQFPDFYVTKRILSTPIPFLFLWNVGVANPLCPFSSWSSFETKRGREDRQDVTNHTFGLTARSLFFSFLIERWSNGVVIGYLSVSLLGPSPSSFRARAEKGETRRDRRERWATDVTFLWNRMPVGGPFLSLSSPSVPSVPSSLLCLPHTQDTTSDSPLPRREGRSVR